LEEDIREVITCFKFGDDRFWGLASAGDQIVTFPIDFDGRPYNTLTLSYERMIIAVCAVAQHCCKGDELFQWKMPYSGSFSSGIPVLMFIKICTVDFVGDPTPHANIGINRPKGGVSAHA